MPGTSVVTWFNKEQWERCGLSWLASFYEFAAFSGDLIIIDYGLPVKARTFLEQIGIRIGTAFLNSVSGTCAFFDHSSYFQAPIDCLFSSDKLLVSVNDKLQPGKEKIHASLLKIAGCYGSTLSDSFVSIPGKLLPLFRGVVTYYDDRGIRPFGTVLNLFALSFPFYVAKADLDPVGDLVWLGDGFWNAHCKQPVVSISANLPVSYQFRTRFPAVYNKWLSYYRGSAFVPKRLFKSRLDIR